MSKTYRGPHDAAIIVHPVTGSMVHVERGVPITELDDLDPDNPEHDLGSDWETADPPKPAPAPKPAPTPEKGDV